MATPRPFVHVALVLLTVIVLAAVLVFCFALWPWFASPPASASAIESRWKAVQAFAAYEQDCKKDPIEMSIREA